MLLGTLFLLLTAAEPEPAPPPPDEAPRIRRPLGQPTPPPLVPATEAPGAAAPVEAHEAPGQLSGPRSRVGLAALLGGEGTFATDGTSTAWFRPRVGMGVRVALTPPEDSVAVPSLALVGGYAGLLDHRVFAELRAELLVAHAGAGMLMPGFTLYALGGFDALLAGGVDPYFGVGIGWDHNVFARKGGTPAAEKPSGGGWGGGWGGLGGGGGSGLAVVLGAVVAAAVAVGVVIGFVCAGRVEFRYHPASRLNAPPTASVLFGFGL